MWLNLTNIILRQKARQKCIKFLFSFQTNIQCLWNACLYGKKDKAKVVITVKFKVAPAASVLFLSLGGDFMSLHFIISRNSLKMQYIYIYVNQFCTSV